MSNPFQISEKLSHVMIFVILLGGAVSVQAHEIYLKDGRMIKTDQVWFEKMGFVLTEQSLDKLKAAGVPAEVLAELQYVLHLECPTEERFLNIIQIRIGRAQLEEYKSLLLQSAEEKTIIKYQQHGGTMSVDRNLVQRLVYIHIPEDSLSEEGSESIIDEASQQVIATERARLQQEYHKLAKLRAKATPEQVPELKAQQDAIQRQISEIDQNPLAYFMKYRPGWINIENLSSMGLSYADCQQICGVLPLFSSPEDQTRYRTCMQYCQAKPTPTPSDTLNP